MKKSKPIKVYSFPYDVRVDDDIEEMPFRTEVEKILLQILREIKKGGRSEKKLYVSICD